MNIAKVFRSGNSQAVRLPKRYRFKGKEVEIFRRGMKLFCGKSPTIWHTPLT
jgi:antitoxin VapB